MPATVDFADDLFCLPPLDIYCATAFNDATQRLAQQLEEDCHQVRVQQPSADAYAEICAWAPDVVVVDATTEAGITLAKKVRAEFGVGMVLIGLRDRCTPPLPVGLFCELLSKPLNYADVARVLGLVPETDDALAVDYTPGRGGSLSTWAVTAVA